MTAATVSPGEDAFQRTLARLGDAGGEAWKPIKGDSPKEIAIRVLRIEERTVNTSQGPASAIVVTGDEGEGKVWDIWCWHTVLHSQMVRARPQPGDVIGCAYLGKVQPQGGGMAYESYRVVRADDQPGAEFDWTGFQSGALAVEESLEEPAPEPSAPVTSPVPEDDIPY